MYPRSRFPLHDRTRRTLQGKGRPL
jgi:hypothetical protein